MQVLFGNFLIFFIFFRDNRKKMVYSILKIMDDFAGRCFSTYYSYAGKGVACYGSL